MINSNFFVIQEQKNVVVEQKDTIHWLFDVQKDGNLKRSFLQFKQDLDVCVVLSDGRAKCQINCAYLVNKNNKININIKVLHKSKNTCSKQQIKGIVTDSANVFFNGLIEIPKESQKCDGQQNHRGIVLSPQAKISAVPQLEIWADDVQCAHGSAIGPLDVNQLFYLQTRGIEKRVAYQLLLQSFLAGLMPSEFNSYIQKWMDENV